MNSDLDVMLNLIERASNGFEGPLTESEQAAVNRVAARVDAPKRKGVYVSLSPYLRALMRLENERACIAQTRDT